MVAGHKNHQHLASPSVQFLSKDGWARTMVLVSPGNDVDGITPRQRCRLRLWRNLQIHLFAREMTAAGMLAPAR